MTETQIELSVERQMDRLDRQLMAGILTQQDYDANVVVLNIWASEAYETLKTQGAQA